MSPHSSSTSSSEPVGEAGGAAGGAIDAPAAPRGHDLREALIVAAWMLLFLAAGDVAINRLFPLPRDPKAEPRGALQVYFNYGWSVEAKIRRAVGATDATTAPLMLAGWVDREVAARRPVPAATSAEDVVSVYGMSFSNQIAEAMAGLDPRIRLRRFGGPSASANHSYAVYERDRGGPGRTVILGVLASSVPGLVTNNAMTWRFESPAAFTYPIYIAGTAGPAGEWPLVHTLDELRARLADPPAWENYLAQLRATDAFYNGFLIRHDFTDGSALVRMVRRAMAQSWQSSRIAQIHSSAGFVEESPAVSSLRAIVAAFAENAQRDGKRPIVLLIEDRGYRDHLTRILEPTLARNGTAYLSTHTICPDTDPRNFIPDGHFTPEGTRKIAKALLELFRRDRRSTIASLGGEWSTR